MLIAGILMLPEYVSPNIGMFGTERIYVLVSNMPLGMVSYLRGVSNVVVKAIVEHT